MITDWRVEYIGKGAWKSPTVKPNGELKYSTSEELVCEHKNTGWPILHMDYVKNFTKMWLISFLFRSLVSTFEFVSCDLNRSRIGDLSRIGSLNLGLVKCLKSDRNIRSLFRESRVVPTDYYLLTGGF